MPNFQPEADLLKTVLQPLLEDFQYWFGRSRSLLETHRINSLEERQQAALLERVRQAQQEVSSAQALFHATGCQVGIESSMMVPWHQLVMECWQVGARFRKEQRESGEK